MGYTVEQTNTDVVTLRHTVTPDWRQRYLLLADVHFDSPHCNRKLLPQSFWTEFRQFLAVNTEASGGTYVDLFDDPRFVATKDYLDTVHLNRWGGAKLVNIIANELARDSSVVTALNTKTDTNSSTSRTTATTQSSYWH